MSLVVCVYIARRIYYLWFDKDAHHMPSNRHMCDLRTIRAACIAFVPALKIILDVKVAFLHGTLHLEYR